MIRNATRMIVRKFFCDKRLRMISPIRNPTSATINAKVDFTVVSAVTHLIATGVMTLDEIEAQLPGFDPLHHNAYGQAYTPEQGEVFAKVIAGK